MPLLAFHHYYLVLCLFLCCHLCYLFVAECISITVKPCPVICVVQIFQIPLQIFLKFFQIKSEIRSTISIGICVFFCVILYCQIYCILFIPVSVYINIHSRLTDTQILFIDIIHIFLRQIFCHLFLEIGVELIVSIKIVFKCHRHIGFLQRSNCTICNAAPDSI